MIMEENTQLPKEVVEEIKKQAEKAYVVLGDIVENINGDYHLPMYRKETGPIEEVLTAYATKLHQANETIKVLTYDNNRLKGEAEGYKSALDELRTKYDNILATESGHESKTENVWQSGYAAGHETGTEKRITAAAERIADKLMMIVRKQLGVDESAAGREEDSRCSVYVPCTEDDPDCCGAYTSTDGRSLCFVKEVFVPLSAFKQQKH